MRHKTFARAEPTEDVATHRSFPDTTQRWSLNIKHTLTTDACSVVSHKNRYLNTLLSLVSSNFSCFVYHHIHHATYALCTSFADSSTSHCIVNRDNQQICCTHQAVSSDRYGYNTEWDFTQLNEHIVFNIDFHLIQTVEYQTPYSTWSTTDKHHVFVKTRV
jgi:hypothetical protein